MNHEPQHNAMHASLECYHAIWSGSPIDCPEQMIAVIRHFGVIPFFRCGIRGWSIEELTAPGCWFYDNGKDGILGPWDWKIDCVKAGIVYGKFLGGKAAFATAEWYRLLCAWRRSLPKYRMALGDAQALAGSFSIGAKADGGRPEAGYKPCTNSDRLMRTLSPLALSAITGSGALESADIRAELTKWLQSPKDKSTKGGNSGMQANTGTDGNSKRTNSKTGSASERTNAAALIRSLGPQYRKVLTPAVKKNVVDSVLGYLEMGTWVVVGDIRRVYRGPELHYSGWQRASFTTPEALGIDSSENGSQQEMPASQPQPAAGSGTRQPAWAKMFEEEQKTDAPVALDCSPHEARERLIAHIAGMLPEADLSVLEKLL